jgi:hypothetical protein
MHDAATSFNLRFSPSGTATWTTVAGASSPYTLTSLTSGTAYDVELQSVNVAGTSAWSPSSTLATTGSAAPNVPGAVGVAPPPTGTADRLTVTWTAPAVDGTHGAANGYNLRYSPAGAGTWTTVTGVTTSPYVITGLTGASAIDVEVQATSAIAGSSAWSAITSGKTWGITVVPGNWTAAATQVHGTNVAPYGGVQLTATAAPTAVTGANFAWSPTNSAIPTTGLITAAPDGQQNGWGQYISAPATSGTFYLWMLAQGAGGVTCGALVSSAISVS